jgi:hypothetical protein
MTRINNSLYEQDFYAWTIKNAELLKQKNFHELDVDNIVEEIESMGRSERRAIMTRLSILLMHLLKWQFQPRKRTRSWELTIKEQRRELADLLEESPSLKRVIDFDKAYSRAGIMASKETKILEYDFPKNCLFSLDDCLDNDFLPQ